MGRKESNKKKIKAFSHIILTGMMGIGALGSLGESMSVVIEKRLSELQEEYDKVKATWFGPEEFNKIKKQLDEESQAKQTLEVHFRCNSGLFQADKNSMS